MSVGLKRKGGFKMPKVVIGFQTSKENKDRVIAAGKMYENDGVKMPLNVSAFCRLAVERFMYDIMKSKQRGEN